MKNTENSGLQEDLHDEPDLEHRFNSVLKELEDIKEQTRCGSCRQTFESMLELGYSYEKTQRIIDMMSQRGYKSWSEVPNEDKKEFKKAVRLNSTEPVTESETTVQEEVVEQKDVKPAQQLNRAKFLKAFKFPARV